MALVNSTTDTLKKLD